MSFVRKLADNIRDARKAAGLTQLQLAQQICVTKNSISMYETAKRTPSLETMSVMASAMNASLDDIVPHVPCVGLADNDDQTTIFDVLGE